MQFNPDWFTQPLYAADTLLVGEILCAKGTLSKSWAIIRNLDGKNNEIIQKGGDPIHETIGRNGKIITECQAVYRLDPFLQEIRDATID